jgi:hypothetical protein
LRRCTEIAEGEDAKAASSLVSAASRAAQAAALMRAKLSAQHSAAIAMAEAEGGGSGGGSGSGGIILEGDAVAEAALKVRPSRSCEAMSSITQFTGARPVIHRMVSPSLPRHPLRLFRPLCTESNDIL